MIHLKIIDIASVGFFFCFSRAENVNGLFNHLSQCCIRLFMIFVLRFSSSFLVYQSQTILFWLNFFGFVRVLRSYIKPLIDLRISCQHEIGYDRSINRMYAILQIVWVVRSFTRKISSLVNIVFCHQHYKNLFRCAQQQPLFAMLSPTFSLFV